MTEKTLHGVEELGAELQEMVKGLGPAALSAAEPAMEEALNHLLGQIPPYPTSDPPKGAMKDASDKARGWFFWAVRQGKIPGWKWVKATKNTPAHAEGRYRQSGHLGQSFTIAVSKTDSAVTGEIGTNAPYAPWVVGPDFPGEDFGGSKKYQAKIHSGRWWQFSDVIDDNIEAAWKIFEDDLLKQIEKAFAEGN
jgi:hypothetical protein